MNRAYTYVIIGNGTAAIGAVEGIRSVDQTGSIAIVSSEPHHCYGRPLISYLLEGKTDLERMKYRPDDFYTRNGCETWLGRTVEKIDAVRKEATLDGGDTLGYDKLLYAAGSSPFIPPTKGLDSVRKVYTFMTLDDALALQQAVTKKSRVLIVGGGLIGLKCAEGIAKLAGSITVVDLAPRILSSILEEESAQIVQKHIERQGIRFLLGQSVASFSGEKASLDSGETLEYDILVMAVGVRPNTALLKAAGARVERGVVTDERMQTSLRDVYAAGDCTESYDISSGSDRILAILPNAYRQGECAGVNMAGGQMRFDRAIPMNAIGFFGLHVMTAGTYAGQVWFHRDGDNYKKLFYDGDLLRGFILIGDVDKAGIYTSLIRERIPLSSIDFELICEKPGLMAFSKKYRDEKLGGIL